jgi:hypothetical protein
MRGCEAIRSAWREAETTYSSKQWSDAWNRLHSAVRSIRTTSMNYLCFNENQIALADEFVSIAQACGIRAYRHDQPQFVVAEQLREMIEAELKEAQERLQGDGRVSTALTQSRLERVAEMSETLIALKSLLGGLGEALEASVETLRSTWVTAQAEGAPRQRALREMIAITQRGREWIAEYLRDPQSHKFLIATDKAREHIGALRALDTPPADALDMIALTALLVERPVAFDPAHSSTIKQLIQQGFVDKETLDPPEARKIWEALTLLEHAPHEASSIEIEAIPTAYFSFLTRTYTE